MSADFMNMLQNMAPRSNRSLQDLTDSNDKLSGMDAMELRGFASQSPMVPSRDLTDELGRSLMSTLQGRSNALKEYVENFDGDRAALVQELYKKRWGPTRIPLYNVILTFLHLMADNKDFILETTRYLAQELSVPVDGTDVTGGSALYWAISTKPFAQAEFAQMLFDAGGSVNQKNRFSATTASEIAQVDFTTDTKKNVQMMEWYVEHGGDVEGKDSDGMNVKMLVEMMRKRVPGMEQVVKKGKGPRKEGECANCGRKPSEKVFSACARCRGVRYCSQECQKVDWKSHKKSCKAAA
ncbi:hypothetical protein CC86DRAFT_382891 [Ophiobolus disseminans]|uniref:MYND-type domain-containing protein n=1 Tax=Ophiobolus disseminans TaxID=1469910 RepID=A0A6A6ZXY1_9PLEO|nr:hypothetical protein CC86DRAFT_382891 [Ophiobolus disseminans]